MNLSNKINYGTSKGIDIQKIHRNVSQELIEITEDKLKLLLGEYLSCISERNAWQTPLALLITIILVLTTTDFKTSLGINASTWSAIFIISTGLCVFWLLKCLWQRPKKMEIVDLINKIKNLQDG